jgi:5-methyltetrahydropteroyltriglutamate--homocysteine methyltransferase
MARSHILGFPRIGARRELKSALESFWRGDTDEASLQQAARALRERHWALQRVAGLSLLTTGDFACYDHMLQQCLLLGALPERFGFDARSLGLAQSFELARGNAAQPAMEMTKWFDTNYHYLVPELGPATTFAEGDTSWWQQIDEALAQGLPVKPCGGFRSPEVAALAMRGLPAADCRTGAARDRVVAAR